MPKLLLKEGDVFHGIVSTKEAHWGPGQAGLSLFEEGIFHVYNNIPIYQERDGYIGSNGGPYYPTHRALGGYPAIYSFGYDTNKPAGIIWLYPGTYKYVHLIKDALRNMIGQYGITEQTKVMLNATDKVLFTLGDLKMAHLLIRKNREQRSVTDSEYWDTYQKQGWKIVTKSTPLLTTPQVNPEITSLEQEMLKELRENPDQLKNVLEIPGAWSIQWINAAEKVKAERAQETNPHTTSPQVDVWMQESPFTKEEVDAFNRYTHFPLDINELFNKNVLAKDLSVRKQLEDYGVNQLTDKLTTALYFYRKVLYNNYLEDAQASAIAPPVSVVGPAKYPTHRIPKAQKIREKAIAKIDLAERYIEKAIGQAIKGKPSIARINKWLPYVKVAKNRIAFGKQYVVLRKEEIRSKPEDKITGWDNTQLSGAFDSALRSEGRAIYDQLTHYITLQPKEQILDNLNPTSGLFVDYTPQKRMIMKLGENITTLDKTSGKSSDEMITIYRGAPKTQKEIVPGDFITTNYDLAKSYTGVGNVLTKKVKMSDVLDDITEPLGEEYIYRPQVQLAVNQTPQERHKEIKAQLEQITKEGGEAFRRKDTAKIRELHKLSKQLEDEQKKLAPTLLKHAWEVMKKEDQKPKERTFPFYKVGLETKTEHSVLTEDFYSPEAAIEAAKKHLREYPRWDTAKAVEFDGIGRKVIRTIKQQIRPIKQKWQMTKSEFIEDYYKTDKAKRVIWRGRDYTKKTAQIAARKLGTEYSVEDSPYEKGRFIVVRYKAKLPLEEYKIKHGASLSNIHKQAINRAISEGKQIPHEVLRDYPELSPPKSPLQKSTLTKQDIDNIKKAEQRWRDVLDKYPTSFEAKQALLKLKADYPELYPNKKPKQWQPTLKEEISLLPQIIKKKEPRVKPKRKRPEIEPYQADLDKTYQSTLAIGALTLGAGLALAYMKRKT